MIKLVKDVVNTFIYALGAVIVLGMAVAGFEDLAGGEIVIVPKEDKTEKK